MKSSVLTYRWALGSDHTGYGIKTLILDHLVQRGMSVDDVGCFSDDSVDYPIIAYEASLRIAKGICKFGVLLCGSGIGMSIVANRFPGIRAALVWNEEIARLSRAHNDANVLVLPARFLDGEKCISILKTWTVTTFNGGRHELRVNQINKLGEKIAGEYCDNA